MTSPWAAIYVDGRKVSRRAHSWAIASQLAVTEYMSASVMTPKLRFASDCDDSSQRKLESDL